MANIKKHERFFLLPDKKSKRNLSLLGVPLLSSNKSCRQKLSCKNL